MNFYAAVKYLRLGFYVSSSRKAPNYIPLFIFDKGEASFNVLPLDKTLNKPAKS